MDSNHDLKLRRLAFYPLNYGSTCLKEVYYHFSQVEAPPGVEPGLA